MSDFIERSMKEFANQFDKKFGDMVFIKTREIEDLQAGVKKLCNRIDELKTENTELKAIKMGDAPSMNPADLCRECELRQRVKELEEAGDRMAKRLCLIINSERTPDNASIDAVKNWWKVKEESK